MTIAGRMVRERERLVGMSDEERAWRKQWLKDLELHHGPRQVPALEKTMMNPIKRFYRAPLDAVYKALTPVLVSMPVRLNILELCNSCIFSYSTKSTITFVNE